MGVIDCTMLRALNETLGQSTSDAIASSGYWETIAILIGTAMLLASDKSAIFSSNKKEEKTEKAGYTKAVSQATAPQAVLLVGYFFLVSWFNGGSPGSLAGLGYLLFGVLVEISAGCCNENTGALLHRCTALVLNEHVPEHPDLAQRHSHRLRAKCTQGESAASCRRYC